MKVEAAVRGLAPEYDGRVDFNVIPAEETNQRTEEMAGYGFAKKRHGLVGFGGNGNVLVTLPGHEYGEPEIRAAAEAVLAGS